MKKLTNANYLHNVPAKTFAVNNQNRGYIDRFVAENYKRLTKKFAASCNINSSGFDSMDKLNELILSLYTDPELHFKNWEEANLYMLSKFTEKEIRISVKKPTKDI